MKDYLVMIACSLQFYTFNSNVDFHTVCYVIMQTIKKESSSQLEVWLF